MCRVVGESVEKQGQLKGVQIVKDVQDVQKFNSDSNKNEKTDEALTNLLFSLVVRFSFEAKESLLSRIKWPINSSGDARSDPRSSEDK